jgi:hypothetical protein
MYIDDDVEDYRPEAEAGCFTCMYEACEAGAPHSQRASKRAIDGGMQ